MGGDPWAGMVDPRAALAAARRTLAGPSSQTSNFSSGSESDCAIILEACAEFLQISDFSKPPSALKQFSGEKSKQKSNFSSSSYTEKTEAYASSLPPLGCPEPDLGSLGKCAPAKVANPLEYRLSHSDHSRIALASPARAFSVTNTVPSPAAHLSGPLAWRDGLARLDRAAPPCPGFRSGEWDSLHRVIAHFMDHYAAEAFARGWTALDLFGVHGLAGAARVDSCGALMLPLLRSATALTAEAIAFGPLVYRRRPLPEAVLAWDYAGGGWREDAR